MGVNAETPVSPLPNMCWYVGFSGDERARPAPWPTQPGNTKSGVPNVCWVWRTIPPILRLSVSNQQRVGKSVWWRPV